MKYVRFSRFVNDEIHWGVLKDRKTIQYLMQPPFSGRILTEETASLSKVKLQAPVDFSKAVCVGLNYLDHAKEMRMEIPDRPVIFIKPSTTANSTEGVIPYPEMCHRLDFEAELAVVISQKCHAVSEKNADDYILGYTSANDITARDLQPEHGQWTLSKCFDGFLPLGPFISDEVNPDRLHIQSRVNGEVKQDSVTSNMIFSVKKLVSFISHCMTLLPGDVICTGTPGGISGVNKGDVIEVEIEGLGVLRNIVGQDAHH